MTHPGCTTRRSKVFIPTPDSTAVIHNYEELYLPNCNVMYLCASTCIEETLQDGLAGVYVLHQGA
jgi:hypothetical protein